MVQRCEKLRLAFEPCQTFAVSRKLFGKHFDRDLAIQLGVTRAIDLTHPAYTDRGADLV